MSDSDEERAPGVLAPRQLLSTRRHANAVDATSARRKEVPRDFLKGKIEKFTAKLERAKSAGNDDDIMFTHAMTSPGNTLER